MEVGLAEEAHDSLFTGVVEADALDGVVVLEAV